MNLEYICEIYDNYKELKNDRPELAKKLLKEVGKGEWMKEQICYYPDDWEFAKYELSDGWYCNNNFKDDYNGAPNPFDYIDMNAFARALVNSWDDSCNREIGEQIVTTGYGW